jgi:hypothetical protein
VRLHPTIEQHGLHLLAVGSSVLLKIPREQFTPLRRVIAFHNECTDDGTALRTKIQPDGITVSRREIVRIADSPDWRVGKSKPFVCAWSTQLPGRMKQRSSCSEGIGSGWFARTANRMCSKHFADAGVLSIDKSSICKS